ncbi:MAG: hypothetical protein ACXACY_25430 [Candidatus Hodarchaeales archaeon]|jgi:hypothetical protein
MSKNIFGPVLITFLLFTANLSAQYQKVEYNSLDIHFRIFGEGTPNMLIFILHQYHR